VSGFRRQGLDEVRGEVLAIPIGEKDLINDLLVLLGYGNGVGSPLCCDERFRAVFDDCAVKLGIDQGVPPEPGIGTADNEFIVEDGDGYLFRNVF
jgi:hypothetical protein